MTRDRQKNQRHARRDAGNIALLTALMMVAILGSLAFASDVGVAYLARGRLISALDAGALAGLSQAFVSSEAAVAMAQQYVRQNGAEATSIAFDPTALTMTLGGRQVVPLYFARILGFVQTDVAATVQATAGALTSGTGFVPIGVVQQSFVYGQTYVLSEGAGDGEDGNYGYLALGGNGAAVFLQNFEYGYSGTLSVGQEVLTEPGVMAGPVSAGVNDRLEATNACTFATATDACARVLLLPVISGFTGHGRSDVTIVGFAAFYLDGLQGSGGHQQIVGQFLQLVVPGTIGTGENFGLYGVRLTE